jgi:ATP-dependent Clp protease ATP-binding subunit ClpA
VHVARTQALELGQDEVGTGHLLLELTLCEAVDLGHNYIGTEHLLLGLLAAKNDQTARLLNELGVTHVGAEEQLVATLDQIRASRQP